MLFRHFKCFERLLSSFFLSTTCLRQLDVVRNRRSDEHRRIGTYNHTYQECEYEALDSLATEDKDSEEDNECTHRGREGTAERIIQCIVDIDLLLAFRIEFVVLAYTVEDNHGIVDRITDNGQDSRDERLVNLHGERHDLPEDSVQTEHDNGIVRKSCQGSYRVCEVTEPQEDIEEDHNECSEDCPDSTGGDIIGDSRTYFLALHDTYCRVGLGRTEIIEGYILAQERLASLVEQCLDSLVSLSGLLVDTIVGRDTNLVSVVTIGNHIEREELAVLQGSRESLIEALAYVLSIDILVETNDIVTSSGEVDTEVQSNLPAKV